MYSSQPSASSDPGEHSLPPWPLKYMMARSDFTALLIAEYTAAAVAF